MKKGLKTAIIILAAVLILGGAIGGYFIHRSRTMYISREEALELALTDSGVDKRTVTETDVEFEKTAYSAVFEVDFETATTEYEYVLDAVTGEILGSQVK